VAICEENAYPEKSDNYNQIPAMRFFFQRLFIGGLFLALYTYKKRDYSQQKPKRPTSATGY
jgi:hypothetical protein